MNRMTSQQRKFMYLGGILALVVPIIWLGMPASSASQSGGHLARLRGEYDLGEVSLGNVDPTSTTMNLMLLGFRGIAVNLLWMDQLHQQETKNFAQMRADVESIILLQPHFKEVWRHHGWNLAYNVSVEWDAVPDRYYWVKEGGKFLMLGTERNVNYPELYWETGRVLGDKIGYSDEWRQFREYFKSDPDTEKYKGGTDPELNPFGRDDNYLAAKDRYLEANRVEGEGYPQRMMMRVLFREGPARSQMNYAGALQREGKFGDIARLAWQDAAREWVDEYGQEPFETDIGEVRLAWTGRDIQQVAEERGHPIEKVQFALNLLWNVTNYHYWKVRAESEAEPETLEAHREIYEGQKLFKEGKLPEAEAQLESGMQKFARLLERHPELRTEDNAVEEAMLAMLYWRYALQIRGKQIPSSYPLQPLWDENQGRLPQLVEDFRFENGL